MVFYVLCFLVVSVAVVWGTMLYLLLKTEKSTEELS